MAILRFPSNVENGDRPYILFSARRATYERNATAYLTEGTGESVALYLPPNYSMNDLFRYETESTGAIGNLYERVTTGTNLSGKDLIETAEAVAVDQAKNISAAAGAAIGSKGGLLGTIGGAVFSQSVAGNVMSEFAKDYQKTLNSREFILFKAPGIRQFGFNFNFIPTSEQEVNAVPEIIKFFRKASYPGTVAANIQYEFPQAFAINFKNSDGLIKIPEVVCIGTNITYNPNSMSYYTVNNFPVEVSLQLSFQELRPIDRQMVEQGY